METDLLKYSETQLNVCTAGFTRRQIHDVVRQAYVYPQRITVCNCIKDPWSKDILSFLGAQWSVPTKQCNSSTSQT
jgi:hypothetical protein